MIGDSERDLHAADKVGVRSILVGEKYNQGTHEHQVRDLWEAAQVILGAENAA